MVGTGDNRQTDPSQGVQPDNEVTVVNPSIRLEPFEPLSERASQQPRAGASGSNESLFKCPLYGSAFANSLGLERHTKNRHPNASVMCVSRRF